MIEGTPNESVRPHFERNSIANMAVPARISPSPPQRQIRVLRVICSGVSFSLRKKKVGRKRPTAPTNKNQAPVKMLTMLGY
jgi:hypothetical protein